jgi:hypothetical protein
MGSTSDAVVAILDWRTGLNMYDIERLLSLGYWNSTPERE